MNYKELIKRTQRPELYEKGTSIMWTDEYISKQLLDLHINPHVDLASRKEETIGDLVNWILDIATEPKMSILDLGCGPGLYSEKLATKGHSVTGVDFSKNSIEYAKNQATLKQLDIDYIVENYLNLDFDNKFDLVLLIYTDLCPLLPEERDKLLKVVHKALKPGGMFIFDVVNDRNVDKKIIPQSWDVEESGFWRKHPYIALANGHHYPENNVILNQHTVINEDDSIDTYHFWSHYYNQEQLTEILSNSGFTDICNYENIIPEDTPWTGENLTFFKAKKT
ncbi:MAG: class I SAM-dependent methyltransferase [Alphaproteobacteria bacterium]|nr:class I SAM-dependent methyltransferase [Alphaproteobacteria bacterium]